MEDKPKTGNTRADDPTKEGSPQQAHAPSDKERRPNPNDGQLHPKP